MALVGILESSYHYLVRLQRVQRCMGFQQPLPVCERRERTLLLCLARMGWG